MTAKHTPGPWLLTGFTVCDTTHHQRIASLWPVLAGPLREEAEANARLIAAAPELLEALEDAVALCKAHGYDMRGADQIIAKARGEG